MGNVGEVPRVSEKEGEAFVANFPLATNEFYKNKEGEEVSKTEWQQNVKLNATMYSEKLSDFEFIGSARYINRQANLFYLY